MQGLMYNRLGQLIGQFQENEDYRGARHERYKDGERD
jgi:hypothetical protein